MTAFLADLVVIALCGFGLASEDVRAKSVACALVMLLVLVHMLVALK